MDFPFLDAHTHLQFSDYDGDRETVVARMREKNPVKDGTSHGAGVAAINVGTDLESSKKAVALAESHEGMWATVGQHPTEGGVFDAVAFRALAAHPKVVAIGECGLDYYHIATSDKEQATRRQQELLETQIALAHEVKKPLMLHCREAYSDLLSILEASRALLLPEAGAAHFFSGTKEDAQNLIALGFSFTFGGVLTFTTDYDELVRAIPADRILSETDAPYVAPVPYRGTRNEPAYVVEVVKKLAELKEISVDEMRAQIWGNAKRLFGI